MKQKKFLLLLLAFVIFLAAAAALYSRLAANQVPQNAAGLAAEQDSGGQQMCIRDRCGVGKDQFSLKE